MVTIPVTIIEEQAFLRECLSEGLMNTQPGFEVRAFSSLAEWRGQRTENIGEVVVLSLRWSKDRADELCRTVRALIERDPTLEIILLSDVSEVGDIVNLVRCGARGCIPTNVHLELAAQAIRLVHAGGTFVPVETFLSARMASPAGVAQVAEDLGRVFTRRQLAVAELLRKGQSNKEIAKALTMEESTVKVHVRAIMRKLNAKNRTQVGFIINEKTSFH